MINLPFLKTHEAQNEKFLTVDINSHNVKCLAFYVDNGVNKVIGMGKKELDPGAVRAGAIIDKDAVEEALKEALAQVEETLGETVNQAIIGVSGSLCLGLTTTVRAKRPQNVPVSKKEIEEIYNKIDEAALIQAQNDYMQMTGNSDLDIDTITRSNVYIKADNSYTDTLEGKQATLVETAMFNAFSPKYHLKNIQTIAKKAGLTILAVAPELYGISQILKNTEIENNDYVLIDLSSDVTSAAVVFGKGIVATKYINVGTVHFIEGISEKMGVTFGEAKKLIKGYTTGKLSQAETDVIKDFLRELLDTWLTGLELMFSDFTGVKTFAPKVYLTGEGTAIPDVTETISLEPWTKSIPFKDTPDFKKLELFELKKVHDSTGALNSSDWLSTAALSVIYNELLEGN